MGLNVKESVWLITIIRQSIQRSPPASPVLEAIQDVNQVEESVRGADTPYRRQI
jgi:hypothetical protein